MIRCIRMWTGPDGNSQFEIGSIGLIEGERDDFISQLVGAKSLSFRETASGGAFEWHEAPAPQYVITLSGILEFETKSGAIFQLYPGDILIAQDTAGSGHKWRLIGDDPWRRAYVIYDENADLGFIPDLPNH